MADLEVEVKGLDEVKKSLGDILSPSVLKSLNRSIGITVRERTADHIAKASVTRHKSADRLGAMHSGFLEFAPARGQLRGGTDYKPQGDNNEGAPFTEVQNITSDGVSVVIGNTPGLRRAFQSLTITPKKAKALTIPIDKISYGRRVSMLKAQGHQIFRPRGTNILAESEGKGKSAKLRPLYALVKKTVIPQDRGLLPSDNDIQEWSADTVEAFLEAMI